MYGFKIRERKLSVSKTPLMPRELDKDLIGISYDEYLIHRNQNSIGKELFDILSDKNDFEYEFNTKIQYLIDTVQDLNDQKDEIKTLWEHSYRLVSDDEINIPSLIQTYYFSLVSITGEANFTEKEVVEIYDKFEAFIQEKINQILLTRQDFIIKISFITQWYFYHFLFLKYLGLGISFKEFGSLKKIYENHINDFENLKKYQPYAYSNFIDILKPIYKNNLSYHRPKFRDFYIEKCYEQIIVSKNSEDLFNYSTKLEDYFTEKYSNKEYVNWALKYLAGYGEEPWRLLILFFLVNFFFTVLFTFTNLGFYFSKDPVGNFEKMIYFFSFNTTTMMTVGYGDIYPNDIASRLLVILLQLLGFIISTSAVTLFIKKIFRF